MISREDVVELQGIGGDITDRKALEENLRLSEREFSTIVRNSPDIICRLDRNLRYIYVSPSMKKALNKLSLRVKTVETHRATVMRKLDINSIVELVHYAIRNQLVEA